MTEQVLERSELPDGERLSWRKRPRSWINRAMWILLVLMPASFLWPLGDLVEHLLVQTDRELGPWLAGWLFVAVCAGFAVVWGLVWFLRVHVAPAAKAVERRGGALRVEHVLGPFRWSEKAPLREIRAVGYGRIAGYGAQVVVLLEDRKFVFSGRIPTDTIEALFEAIEEWAEGAGAQIDPRLRALLRLQQPSAEPGPPPEGRLRLCGSSDGVELTIEPPGWFGSNLGKMALFGMGGSVLLALLIGGLVFLLAGFRMPEAMDRNTAFSLGVAVVFFMGLLWGIGHHGARKLQELTITAGAIRLRSEAPFARSREDSLRYERPPRPRLEWTPDGSHGFELTGDRSGVLRLALEPDLDSSAWLWAFLHHLPPAPNGSRDLPPPPGKRLRHSKEASIGLQGGGFRDGRFLSGLFFLVALIASLLASWLLAPYSNVTEIGIVIIVVTGCAWAAMSSLRVGWKEGFARWRLAVEPPVLRAQRRALGRTKESWKVEGPLEVEFEPAQLGCRGRQRLRIRGHKGDELLLELDLTDEELAWVRGWLLAHLPRQDDTFS